MSARGQVVIIGAGPNGLVAAFYLARAGFRPLVLERRPLVGGIAVTEEFYPGFPAPTLAHAAAPLYAEIARDMQLEQHGLEILSPQVRLCALSPDGPPLLLYDDPRATAAALAARSPRDAERYAGFHHTLARLARVFAALARRTPPSLDDPSPHDLYGLLRIGLSARLLGKQDLYRLLRWAPMPVADLMDEWFESALLKAAIASRAIFASALGPRSAGSTHLLLVRSAEDPHPAGPAASFRGGIGALTQAMARAAVAAGAEIRTDSEVAEIVVRDGAVAAVRLGSGEEIAARTVISNADPVHTLLHLLDPEHLSPRLLSHLQHYRCSGVSAKINLALDGLPHFAGLDDAGGSAALAGRIHIGPTIDYLERAFDASKYGAFSREPFLDVTIPTLADPSLAPPGKHVMSVHMQFAPYELREGNWSRHSGALAETVVRVLAAYVPELPARILHAQVLTPRDIESRFALTGGHLLHGEQTLDQFFVMRPLLGWARYRTPVRGLYLCGSGTHPGSAFTGASGANGAREVIRDLRASGRKA
jgi:phytoene dehydrogenase-like protein